MTRGRKPIRDGLTNAQRYYRRHREELRQYRRDYVLKNKDRLNGYSWNLKRKVVEHYSPSCSCVRCGIIDIRVLTIDHVKGDGAAQRKANNLRGGQLTYAWLKRNDYPSGFQVLCYNCQRIKQIENHEFVKRVTWEDKPKV